VITKAQFSVLVCVVALSAVVPTVVAQRLIARNPVLEGEIDASIAPLAVPGPDDDDEVAGHRAAHPPAAPSVDGEDADGVDAPASADRLGER